MPKITFIGAGSTIFLRHLLGDAVLMPSLSNAEIALMDIDEQRLAESELVARRVVETLKAGASVTATTSRREALDGADFVIVSVQIGGYKPCTVTDFEIPKKYGLRQTIADTLGIGGIMRGLPPSECRGHASARTMYSAPNGTDRQSGYLETVPGWPSN